MATIRNSELTVEQWEEMRDKTQDLKRMSFSEYTKLFETDILKEGRDYIYTEPLITGKRQALETAQKMKELDRSLFKFDSSMTDFTKTMASGTSTINTTGFTREIKDGDVRFGSDGVEIYQVGEWKSLLGRSGIDKSKIRGLSANSTIIDDPGSEEQIVSDNTDVLAEIKKASQLDIKAVPEEERRIEFHGGMVAMYLNDKGFRRKAAKACNMTFVGFYDGKKKGVICKLMPTTPEDFINGGFPVNMDRIEVPVTELTSCFSEWEVWKVLGGMFALPKDTVHKPAASLYSEEYISGLPDFGAF